MENNLNQEKESWLVRNHIFLPLIISLGEAITLGLLIDSFYEKSHKVSTHVLFAIFLLLFIVACIFSVYYMLKTKKYDKRIKSLESEKQELIVKDNKNEMYKKAFKEINHAYKHIHKLSRDKGNSKDYVTALSNFCTNLADTFKSITGENCCVCIKYTSFFYADELKSKTPEIALKTLCRDIHSFQERGIQDNGSVHLLKHNTDFEEVFKKISEQHNNCFFSNDLTKIHAYGNTSFLKYGEDSHKPFGQYTKAEDRCKAWKLPYRSTIVAPICPDIDERKKGEEDKYVQGFLCIDSKREDIFDSAIDIEILLGCADGLYNTIKEFKNIIEREEAKQLRNKMN